MKNKNIISKSGRVAASPVEMKKKKIYFQVRPGCRGTGGLRKKKIFFRRPRRPTERTRPQRPRAAAKGLRPAGRAPAESSRWRRPRLPGPAVPTTRGRDAGGRPDSRAESGGRTRRRRGFAGAPVSDAEATHGARTGAAATEAPTPRRRALRQGTESGADAPAGDVVDGGGPEARSWPGVLSSRQDEPPRQRAVLTDRSVVTALPSTTPRPVLKSSADDSETPHRLPQDHCVHR